MSPYVGCVPAVGYIKVGSFVERNSEGEGFSQLHQGGGCNVVSKILSLSTSIINDLADEAVACLACLNGDLQFSSTARNPIDGQPFGQGRVCNFSIKNMKELLMKWNLW